MTEKILFNATIVFLIREKNGIEEVLLARKMKKIGVGCRNGYGGGIEENETPEQSACRECKEESGIDILEKDLRNAGIIDFHNTKSDGKEFTAHCHLFTVREWKGEPQETEEMENPLWFPVSQLPFDELMPADKFWIPKILSGKRIQAEAHYGPFQKELFGEIKITEI